MTKFNEMKEPESSQPDEEEADENKHVSVKLEKEDSISSDHPASELNDDGPGSS